MYSKAAVALCSFAKHCVAGELRAVQADCTVCEPTAACCMLCSGPLTVCCPTGGSHSSVGQALQHLYAVCDLLDWFC